MAALRISTICSRVNGPREADVAWKVSSIEWLRTLCLNDSSQDCKRVNKGEVCVFRNAGKKEQTYSNPTSLAELGKKCWELVQITSLTFKAMTLTVVAIVLEPVVFSVSATAEHAVFSYGGLRMFPKSSHTLRQNMHPSISVTVKNIKQPATLSQNYFLNTTSILYFNFRSWSQKWAIDTLFSPNMCRSQHLVKCFKLKSILIYLKKITSILISTEVFALLLNFFIEVLE